MSPQKLVFLLAACGSGGVALAQRAAIVPLAPVVPAVVAPSQPGVNVTTQFPTQPAAPIADQLSRAVLVPRARSIAGHVLSPTIALSPVYILNSHLLVGENWLRAIKPQEIKSLVVYKDTTVPARWRSFAANGILDFTLKKSHEPVAQKLIKLGKALGLIEPVRFTLEGLPLEDLSLSIATNAIAALEIIHPATGATGTMVNIRLVDLPPAPSLPGIYIRGKVASY